MDIRIRYIDPVSDTSQMGLLGDYMRQVKCDQTEVEIVTLPIGRPRDNIEFQSYEALVMTDIIKIVRDAAQKEFDAVVIGCFYDPCLNESREISGNAIVVGPCFASLQMVSNISNRFSVLVGREKFIERMNERIRDYGYFNQLASFRSVDLNVIDFANNPDRAKDLLIEEGYKAIKEDRAEAILLGCTGNFDQYKEIQDELGVPVIDPVLASLKRAEELATLKNTYGWGISRIGSLEPPPESEINELDLFESESPPIGSKLIISKV